MDHVGEGEGDGLKIVVLTTEGKEKVDIHGDADTVDSFDAAATATANKLLALNASSKLPASITGDADTVDSFDAAATPTASKLLAMNANAKFPTQTVHVALSVGDSVVTITPGALPISLGVSPGWIVVDPYTSECETRRITDITGNVVTFTPVLAYNHAKGDAILWLDKPLLSTRHYGLLRGTGMGAAVQQANRDAILNALADATAIGGAIVSLPAGDIEIYRVNASNLGDGVVLRGAGMGATVLHFQKDSSGAGITLRGAHTDVTTFLVEDADGADVKLRCFDVTDFVADGLVRLRDYSTDSAGKGSWPFNRRANMYNGEFLYTFYVDTVNDELDLDFSVQSSVNYEVHNIQVAAPGAAIEDVLIPVTATGGYEVGAQVIIILDGGAYDIRTVGAVDPGVSITVTVGISANAGAGNQVYIHCEVRQIEMAKGLAVEDFTIQVPSPPSDSYGGLSASWWDNLKIERVAVYGGGLCGIAVGSCVNGAVENCVASDGDFAGCTLGYGVLVEQSQWMTIGNIFSKNQRRAIDLAGGHPTRHTLVHDCILIGSGVAAHSVCGTHGPAEDCDFANNIIAGGTSIGLYIRGNRINAKGNLFAGSHYTCILYGGGSAGSLQYSQVLGNTAQGCERYSVDSGNRWVSSFIRLLGSYTIVHSRGNSLQLETQHTRVDGTGNYISIADEIRFRPGAPGTQAIVNAEAAAAVELTLNSTVINMDTIATGAGTVTQLVRSYATGFNIGTATGAGPGDINASGGLNVGTTGTMYGIIVSQGDELTLDTDGAITVGDQSFFQVDTFEDAAADDLVTISGGTSGQIIILRTASSSRDVTVKNATGNIFLGADFTLDNWMDRIVLQKDGTNWFQLCQSSNA